MGILKKSKQSNDNTEERNPEMAKEESVSNEKALTTSISNDLLLADAETSGHEFTKDDLMVPRIIILQDLSPQVKKKEDAYIEGAEVGDLCIAATEQIFKGEDGVLVVPISYRRTYIERTDESSSKFVADHGLNEELMASCSQGDKGKRVMENGNLLVETSEYFVYIIDEKTGTWTPAVVTMAKSQRKHAKKWNTLITSYQIPHPSEQGRFINPAMFYRSYRLTTRAESNSEGSWMGWHITPCQDTLQLDNGESIYLGAREFKKQVDAGVKRADHESGGGESESSGEDAPF